MRFSFGAKLIALTLQFALVLPVAFAAVEDTPLLNCSSYNTTVFTAKSNTEADPETCRANVCRTLYTRRNAYFNELENYSDALEDPFEELFLRLKTSLENYDFDLRSICGTEADPLPVCQVTGGDTIQDNDVAQIRAGCTQQVTQLLDIADTVLHEYLLQMAGNQRTHAYAKRIDALAEAVRGINETLAHVVTYMDKIKLTFVVGSTPKQ